MISLNIYCMPCFIIDQCWGVNEVNASAQWQAYLAAIKTFPYAKLVTDGPDDPLLSVKLHSNHRTCAGYVSNFSTQASPHSIPLLLQLSSYSGESLSEGSQLGHDSTHSLLSASLFTLLPLDLLAHGPTDDRLR